MPLHQLKPGQSLRCPSCHKTEGLWRNASRPGFVPVDPDGTEGRFEADGRSHEHDDDYYGCGECSSDGFSFEELIVSRCPSCDEIHEKLPVDGYCSRKCLLQGMYAEELAAKKGEAA